MSWPAKPSRSACALFFCALTAAAGTAMAGRTCEEKITTSADAAATFDAALSLAARLDATGQTLLIIARRGQDLEKYQVRFSHAAYAIRQDGAWQVYHELNTCGTAVSRLYVQGLAEFLADDLASPEVAVVAPEAWLQARLSKVLASKDEQFRMHEPHYNAVAYPFSLEYQNSNGWVLESFARAASETLLSGRADAQRWLRKEGYAPEPIDIGMLTRLGARMFKANVAFDDQPPELRWRGRITASTGDAVLRFVSRFALPQPTCVHGGFDAQVCMVTPGDAAPAPARERTPELAN
jgi:hypothetical protein